MASKIKTRRQKQMNLATKGLLSATILMSLMMRGCWRRSTKESNARRSAGLIWNDKFYLQPWTTRHGDYPWGPGEVARYDSISTFILSASMDAFLKSKEGPDADIWEMVLTEVL